MKAKITTVVFSVIVLSCNLSDETHRLSGRWLYVNEGEHDKVLDGGFAVIPCEVTHYGFDDSFIIAMQKPAKDCFLRNDTNLYTGGMDSAYYWIVIHKDKRLLGPLLKQEFEQLRDSLQIPNALRVESVR